MQTLADLVRLKRGYDLPTRDRKEGPIPVLGSFGITGWHNEAKGLGPGVSVGRSGASIGVATWANGPYWPLNTTLYATDFKGNDPRFVYYVLDSIDFAAYNSGSAQPSLNRNFIASISVRIPPISIQRKIAAVLAAYDELIENNLRRIEILEEMAQAVYREWFVNFRFPGHEDVALVDSPLGPITDGWEGLVLGEVLSMLESGSRPRGGIDPDETGVPSVGAENVLGLGKYDYSKDKYISRSFFETMRRGHVRSGDVLLYKDGAKLGRKSLFRDGFPHVECAINEHVFLLRTNGRVSQSFLYFWLDLPASTQRIIDLNSNAAQPGISQPKVLGLPILVPPSRLVEHFDTFAEPLLALLFNLARQNRNLGATRDLLLPKLVSGEIDVSDLNINTEWLAS
jgi:type I restriction enzyme S subunit